MQLSQYKILGKIGSGRYGVVQKAINIQTSVTVAIKEVKIENENEGIPISTLREIVILKGLKHKNVVELLDTIIDAENNKIYMILEYMNCDLFTFITATKTLTHSQKKVN